MWSRDGTELFYLQDERRMMAVKVTTQPTFRSERPAILFEGDIFITSSGDQSYDVTADGRFLMMERESPQELLVVTNFLDELKARIPN